MLGAFVSQAATATPPPKPPKDAPFCLAPGTRPVFVAPTGAVFRAAPGAAYPAKAWIAAADRNGDGQVDRSEFAADAARFFNELDRDRDGRLTPEEVSRYENEVAPEIALYAGRLEPGDRPRRAAPAARSGAGRFAWLDIPEPVAAADADLDRVVTAIEYRAAMDRRFNLLAGAAAGISPPALPRTPQQAALEGPCRPLPVRRRDGAAGAES